MALIKLVPVEEEMKKNPELKKSDIEILREWYEKQPHLPKITDNELILFIHSNYYRLEPTKNTLDTFYTVRTHVPEIFSNRDPIATKSLRKTFDVGTFLTLEQPTKEGYKIIFGKLIDSDPAHYVYFDAMKYFNMLIDLWLYTEGTSPGHIILFDTKEIQLGHAGRLNPMGLKKVLYYLQEGLPVRLKGFHFMNTSPAMDLILNMMKPFMKKELLEIFHMHSSLESLEKFVPIEALPNESGGKAGPLLDLHAATLKRIEDHRAWFQYEEVNARVDESRRPGKAKSASDLFGVEGTFKKLEID